ncbi:hypothetical protein TgHK011_009151 [Trichoderma gracile]|nr:hypothetical protein TgHK011_009151 [Trichoderma gracile]
MRLLHFQHACCRRGESQHRLVLGRPGPKRSRYGGTQAGGRVSKGVLAMTYTDRVHAIWQSAKSHFALRCVGRMNFWPPHSLHGTRNEVHVRLPAASLAQTKHEAGIKAKIRSCVRIINISSSSSTADDGSRYWAATLDSKPPATILLR